MILELGGLVVGALVLALGGDQFVLGAARIAAVRGLSPVAVGALVVGFGTSAPEMLVSGIAAGQGDLGLGVGNVIGSNVANLTLVLGGAALIAVVPANRAAVSREAPIAFGGTVLFALLVQGGLFRWEGAGLAVAAAVALTFMLRASRGGATVDPELAEMTSGDLRAGHEAGRTLLGLVGTIGGAWLLVWAAVGLADRVGLSGGFVGFTLVAVGTSLPELVTAAAGARRGETDLVLGNLLGSNTFNSLVVGGLIALVGPGSIPDAKLVVWGSLAMVAVSVIVWIFIITDRRLARVEGLALLAFWLVSLPLLYEPS